MKMVRAAAVVVGLWLLVGAQAQQGPQVGACDSFQTTPAFNEAFISKLQENEEGYSFLLTSGPTFGCQKIKFLPNGTYHYDFVDLTNSRVNASGSYTMRPFSFGLPASITLFSLPFGELSSALGTISFNVLRADDDLLVLISCLNYGFFRTQQLHVLIPESQSASIVAQEVNEIIQKAQVPLASYLTEVQQTCAAGARQSIWQLLSLYRWLVKFGIIPPILGDPQQPSVYSSLAALDNFVLAPQLVQQYQVGVRGEGSPFLSTVQSFVHPQLPSTQSLQNEVPYFFGQRTVPQIQTQFGLQKLQNPILMYPGIPTTHDVLGLPSTQFHDVAANNFAKSGGWPTLAGRPLNRVEPLSPV